MRVVIQQGGCPPGGWAVGRRVRLNDGEIQHLKVRRAKDGDEIEIMDGAGLVGRGIVVQLGRDWEVEIRHARVEEPPPETTLAVAAGDRDRFSWMVEKAVELGVTRIVPLETNRTAGVATRVKQTHLERLRRSALETIKQCGTAWVPAVEELTPLGDFTRGLGEGSRWLADQNGKPVPSSLDREPMSVVIGPEGGLTESERDTLITAGFQPVSLGPHTLRFETAAVAAAAAISQARMRGLHV
jgi:16S rRNA (uracil1498-N3)-methyltransferase